VHAFGSVPSSDGFHGSLRTAMLALSGNLPSVLMT
jgi:hypothetical protein